MPESVPLPRNGDYAELRRIVRAEGLLEARDGYYAVKLAVAVATIAAGVLIALVATHPAIILADAVFLAFGATQAALLSHDIIHRQAFRGKRLNGTLRLLIGNLLLGISHTWWDEKHSQHHANPNHIDKDPDIQLPFIVFSADRIAEKPRWMRPFIAMQAVFLVLVFPFQAIAMYWTSAVHLAKDAPGLRVVQVALIAAHFALAGALIVALPGGWPLAATFAAVHLGTFGLYNSSVFASNHKGMPLTADGKRLDFLREQVMTSRDVDGHPITDFWYGGLNYQIEHHLFPTMPRKNLPRAQAIVREFCAERGIVYHSTSLAEAYREGLAHLHQASASLRRGNAVTS